MRVLILVAATVGVLNAVHGASGRERYPYEIIQIGGTAGLRGELDRVIEGQVAPGVYDNPLAATGQPSRRTHLLDLGDAPGLEGAQLLLTFEVIYDGPGRDEPLLLQVFNAGRAQNPPADSPWPPGWVTRGLVDTGHIRPGTPVRERQVTVTLSPEQYQGVIILADNGGGRVAKRYRVRITRLRRQPVLRDLTPEQQKALQADRAGLYEDLATLLEPRHWDSTRQADQLLGPEYEARLKARLERVADLTGFAEYTAARDALEQLHALPRQRARWALRVLNMAALSGRGNLGAGAHRLRECAAAVKADDLLRLQNVVELARSEVVLARSRIDSMPATFTSEARDDARAFIEPWFRFIRAERQYLGLEEVDALPPAPDPKPPPD